VFAIAFSYSIPIACTYIFTSLAFVIRSLHHFHHSYLSVLLISTGRQLSTSTPHLDEYRLENLEPFTENPASLLVLS